MLDLLDRLKQEWHVIQGAKFSFLVVCAIVVGLCFVGLRYVYRDKLLDAEKRAAQWKTDAEYWKEIANRPPAQQKPVEKPVEKQPVNTSKPKESKKEPALFQTAPNGINIGRDNTGTAVVNNFSPPERHLTPQQVTELSDEASALPDTQVVSVLTTNDPKSENYGREIYDVIANQSKSKLKPGPTIGLGGWTPRAPEGVIVCIKRQEAQTFSTAMKIATTINSNPATKVNFTRCDGVEENEIRIVIGPA